MNDFSNYFNYFTEIEEHFQKARGTSLFLLSPLDWALIESWKASDIPLEAVLIGIDTAFEKWRARKSKTQRVNSLAFCSQAVLAAAQRKPEQPRANTPAPFPADAIRSYLEANHETLLRNDAVYHGLAASLQTIIGELNSRETDLEALEQTLTVLEEQMIAIARTRQSEAEALTNRKELESYIKPYRSKMSAPQIAMLEAQFLQRLLLDAAKLPRLSLFYLR